MVSVNSKSVKLKQALVTDTATKAFKRIDKDRDGTISRTEFGKSSILRKVGVTGTETDTKKAFETADSNKDGVLSRKEADAYLRSLMSRDELLAGFIMAVEAEPDPEEEKKEREKKQEEARKEGKIAAAEPKIATVSAPATGGASGSGADAGVGADAGASASASAGADSGASAGSSTDAGSSAGASAAGAISDAGTPAQLTQSASPSAQAPSPAPIAEDPADEISPAALGTKSERVEYDTGEPSSLSAPEERLGRMRESDAPAIDGPGRPERPQGLDLTPGAPRTKEKHLSEDASRPLIEFALENVRQQQSRRPTNIEEDMRRKAALAQYRMTQTIAKSLTGVVAAMKATGQL